MIRLFLLIMWSVSLFADFSPSLLQNKNFKLAGNFYPYPFHPTSSSLSAYNWAFKTPLGHVYQMYGTEPTFSNVFGWKRVDVKLTTQPLWRFYFIGDLDKDGDTRFDFIAIHADNKSNQVFKLLPVPVGSFFKYKDMGFWHYKSTSDSITFYKGVVRYLPLLRSLEFSTYPKSLVVHTFQEAKEFLDQHPSALLRSNIKTIDFDFFNLVLYSWSEPSGAIKIQLQEPLFVSDEVVKVAIQKSIPPIGTADMAYYLLGVLVSKDIQKVVFDKGKRIEAVSTLQKECQGDLEIPVCGLKQIECVMASCEPLLVTYPDICALQADTQATFLYEGPCDGSETK